MNARPSRPRRRLALAALPAAGLLATSCGASALEVPPATSTSTPPGASTPSASPPATGQRPVGGADARRLLEQLPVKGRAPMTGYERAQFGQGWATLGGCDVRDRVLAAQLTAVRFAADRGGRCIVLQGDLADPYTGRLIHFVRGGAPAAGVDLDHLVALGDAWQTGAQQLTAQRRAQFANDVRNLRAVDPSANRQKGDSDAASWLPPNRAFRCSYVSTQIAVKAAYTLWVTPAEKAAMSQVLSTCPAQAAN